MPSRMPEDERLVRLDAYIPLGLLHWVARQIKPPLMTKSQVVRWALESMRDGGQGGHNADLVERARRSAAKHRAYGQGALAELLSELAEAIEHPTGGKT